MVGLQSANNQDELLFCDEFQGGALPFWDELMLLDCYFPCRRRILPDGWCLGHTPERLLTYFDIVSLGALVETLELMWPEESMDTQPNDDTASSVESFLLQLTNL
ncbi:hypothetical protein EXIGLDRAFT_773278 [Exidia glandulosa HHB12029]|uniref:Uncharacterized protein n=1 Tax=Exidia glandulosa HHB12029 TaxID=1314781 RepID=A0A165EVU4_EXIGL|nr:hypothetical protein EXIGLDRAFT_773278 [Exidia glandulosa HHB12029]